MKTYNALSKSFTDEVKTIMGGGKSIDDAFIEVKLDIIGDDFDDTIPTPIPDSTPTPSEPTPAPIATPPPTPESPPTPSPGSTPTPSEPTPAPESPTPTPGSTPAPEIDINELTQGDGQQDGFYYVDLGLSVKWATCNVGADLASDEGKLFQFGRVDGYKYGDTNNQFRTNAQNKQDTGNEYIPKTASGKTYNADETLDLKDDAAHVNMGGAWRMPTKDELEELLNNTTHKVKTINNKPVMLFTSTINGHQLFIPFAGGWYYGKFDQALSRANVWSSKTFDVFNAYSIRCYSNGTNAEITFMNFHSCAFSVRGVFKNQE